MRKAALILAGFLIVIAVTFVLLLSQRKKYDSTVSRKVQIEYKNGIYSLLRNGQPFTIKGVAGDGRISELAACGGNTIRVFDTTNLGAILKEAAAHNIAVIAGIYLPPSGDLDYYNDTVRVREVIESAKKIVNKYKNSPALLMWCVGNELYFPLRGPYKNFYKAFNGVVNMIHHHDPNHPTTTTMVNMDIKNILSIKFKTNIDVVAFNIFYGQLKQLSGNLKKYRWIWKDPYLITEWGIDGPWEEAGRTAWMAPFEPTGNEKAVKLTDAYDNLPKNDGRILGACAFFWGAKQETTHTWFSIFSDNGAASPMKSALKFIWSGLPPQAGIPQLSKIALNDNPTEYDSPLFNPGAEIKAHLQQIAKPNSNYTYHWELYDEDWARKGIYINNEKKLKPLIESTTFKNDSVIYFIAPRKEGPYRLFVNVFDTSGNFSSCNIPFYVVSQN